MLAAIRELDPQCHARVAKKVLALLRKAHEVDEEEEMLLLQGLCVLLSRQGFGVTLHLVSADAVRSIILETARLRHAAKQRKLPRAERQQFDSTAAMRHMAEVKDKNDTGEPLSYCVGWTVVPPNMMRENLLQFQPVDAIDAAASHGRAGGVFIARATLDANRQVHPVSVSHILAAEGRLDRALSC